MRAGSARSIPRRPHPIASPPEPHRRWKPFVEEVLPVESVAEYFAHFRVLELDFTFYRPLLEEDGQPGQNYRVLERYRQFLKENDRILLKVPQLIFAQKLWHGDKFTENQAYLDPRMFVRRFYEPAVDLFEPT